MAALTAIFIEGEAAGITSAAPPGRSLTSILYCFFAMKEPQDAPANAPSSILNDLKSIGPMFVNNPPLMWVFTIIVIASICIGMFGKNMLYHFKHHLERPEPAVIGLVLRAALLILAVPGWVALAGKTSKRNSLTIGVWIALAGWGAALAVMFWAILPDTVEYGEVKTGVRVEAKTFGFATFAQKAAVGVNAVLLGWLLSAAGFEANAEQSEATLLGMKAIMALVPAAGAVAILLILRGYRLDRYAHADLVAQLRARRAAE